MATLSLITADWLVVLGLLASLNIIVGKIGIWSIGHLAFFAAGQLLLGAAVVLLGWPLLPSMAFAVMGSGVLALLLGVTTLRLDADFFIIASIAMATVVQGVTMSVLGPHGVSGIPRLLETTAVGESDWLYLAVTLVPLLIVMLLLTNGYSRSPVGRISAAVRTNEDIAESLGISTFGLRLAVFVSGSVAAAVVGCISATYYGMTDPAGTTLYHSILVFAILLLGGVDSIKGTVVASVLLVVVPRLIEFLLGTPDASFYAGKLSELIFGLLVLLLVRVMPRGILGNRRWAA